MHSILIIDDDVDICMLLGNFLRKHGFQVESVHSGKAGMLKLTQQPFDLVITDFRLGDIDGREILKRIKAIYPNMVVVMITAYIDIKIAIDVVKSGAYDYITKPLIPGEILSIIKSALNDGNITPDKTDVVKKERETTATTKPSVQQVADNSDRFMESKSKEFDAIQKQINVVAPTDYSVILYGESGTGKEVVARKIHAQSKRSTQPFMAVDCGTLTKELAGSELFGHEKGSFTGAIAAKVGSFELANGGTLFLDEVANLPYEVQMSLLRVIQERKIRRVGGNEEINVDVRILVASNENLMDAYKKGTFREDLFHRFNEFSINIPPLRQRKDDIMEFANYFLNKTNAELGKSVSGFEPKAEEVFMNYSWPGNLREMRNVIRRAVLLTEKGVVKVSTLPVELGMYNETDSSPVAVSVGVKTAGLPLSLKETAQEAEFIIIQKVLQQVRYNKTKAAAMLNIDRKTLYNKLKEHNLDTATE